MEMTLLTICGIMMLVGYISIGTVFTVIVKYYAGGIHNRWVRVATMLMWPLAMVVYGVYTFFTSVKREVWDQDNL